MTGISLFSNNTISEEDAQPRLDMLRKRVAQPILPSGHRIKDVHPAEIADTAVLIGNKYHAADIPHLLQAGVTAVLNCASGGISRLPVDELQRSGIRYHFTNVRQDHYSYPILFDPVTLQCSQHLEVAKQVYNETVQTNKNGGKVLFFCVAGQVCLWFFERQRERERSVETTITTDTPLVYSWSKNTEPLRHTGHCRTLAARQIPGNHLAELRPGAAFYS